MKSNALILVDSKPVLDAQTGGVSFVGITSGLLFVLFVIFIGYLIVRKMTNSFPSACSKRVISLKESCSLGQREKIVLAEVNGRYLVLGVTASGITCLTSFDSLDETLTGYTESTEKSFSELLMSNLRYRVKCRK